MCLHRALFLLIWYATWLLSEKNVWIFDPIWRWGILKGQNMCLQGAICSVSFNLTCNMTTFRKKNVLTFDHIPGVAGVWKDRVLACMLLRSSFPLIWYATWPCIEKAEFWPFGPTPRVRCRRSLWSSYLLPCYCICHSLCFNILKSWSLASVSPQKSTQADGPRHLNSNPVWFFSYLLYFCLQAKFLSKTIDKWLSYCKI